MPGYAPNKISSAQVKSNLLNIAQTSIYMVKVQPPSDVVSFLSGQGYSYSSRGNDLELMCSSATLPGNALVTHEVTNDYAGVSEKMAYRRMYDSSLDLTFYVDRNYGAIDFFDGWIDYITNMSSKSRMKSPYTTYRMSYPTTYKTNIFLTKFEKDAVGSYLHYTFVDAFPQNVTSIPVSYEGSNLLQCSVSMSYIRYVREKQTISTNTTTTSQQQQTLNFQTPTSSAVQAQFAAQLGANIGIGANDLFGTTSNIS